MNVLSLFDGMSCGQIALNRAGIKYGNYYASEIDKWTIKVTQHNYPNTIQIGDVTQVHTRFLPKIDLLIGGSPCQGFSMSGKMLNFNDARSKLFFEFVRLLKECKPKYFLLENVKMKKEWQNVITEHLGVEPIEINSALVSAQNRRRLYWTNIPNITQPEDKGILLKDILEYGTEKVIVKTIPHGYMKESYDEKKKYPSLCAQSPASKHLVSTIESKYRLSDKAIKTLSKYAKDYKPIGKAPTLTTEMAHLYGYNFMPRIVKEINDFRRLTPTECEALQTVPKNYTAIVSDTQRYKMLGNAWTVDVIVHIFKNIKEDNLDG